MKKAFTLLELLCVCVIIGLLSAIVFSVFSSTRTKSHEAVCLSNLRQIGLGVKMYESDYSDIPHEFKTLYPTYVSRKQVFRCPQWEAYLSTLPNDKQEKYASVLTMYTYEPEEAHFWSTLPREAGDPDSLRWTWQKFYQKRGERLPIVLCHFHDPLADAGVPFGPDGRLQMTRMVLRLDGSVEKATAHQVGKGISWSDL